MTVSEIEDFLLHWPIEYEKGFKYYDYGLFGAEYVVVKRTGENLFEILRSKSTCQDGPFNAEKITKLLGSNRLVPFGNDGYSINFRKTKCGNCECGAWATNNPTCHARWCPMCR